MAKNRKYLKENTTSLKKGIISPKKRDLLMLRKESRLLYLFAVRPWQACTESELRVSYGKKSKSYVELFLDKYIKEGVLKTEQMGKITTYALNLSSAKAKIYAGIALESVAWSKSHIPYKDMEALIDKIPYANRITLVTGSYAKGTQRDESDIDVVVIIEDSCDPKKVKAELNLQSELNIPPIHLYVFRNLEFIEMLTNRHANYGKEIIKNCLILTQGQTYLNLIDEAIKHGFNGKALY